jgi:hypothetical protein
MKYTRRSFKAAGFLTPVLTSVLTLVLTLVSLSACGNNPIVDKILGDTDKVPYGVFFTSQVGKYANNMHELAPYINENRESHDQFNPIQATFLGNDFNEIRKVFIGKNGVVEETSFVSLDMRLMEDALTVPENCFNGYYVEADGVGKVGDQLTAKIVEAWLPECVETLEELSFANNFYLAVISMPEVVEISGKDGAGFAFTNSSSLKEFYLPAFFPGCEGTFKLNPSSPEFHVPPQDDTQRNDLINRLTNNFELDEGKTEWITPIIMFIGYPRDSNENGVIDDNDKDGYSMDEYRKLNLDELFADDTSYLEG